MIFISLITISTTYITTTIIIISTTIIAAISIMTAPAVVTSDYWLGLFSKGSCFQNPHLLGGWYELQLSVWCGLRVLVAFLGPLFPQDP